MGCGTLEVLERDRAELVVLRESQMGDPEREDDSQDHVGVGERAGLGILPQLPFLSASQEYTDSWWPSERRPGSDFAHPGQCLALTLPGQRLGTLCSAYRWISPLPTRAARGRSRAPEP